MAVRRTAGAPAAPIGAQAGGRTGKPRTMRLLAIDFGTSNTVAALSVDGQAARTVTFDASPLLPSVGVRRRRRRGGHRSRGAAPGPARPDPLRGQSQTPDRRRRRAARRPGGPGRRPDRCGAAHRRHGGAPPTRRRRTRPGPAHPPGAVGRDPAEHPGHRGQGGRARHPSGAVARAGGGCCAVHPTARSDPAARRQRGHLRPGWRDVRHRGRRPDTGERGLDVGVPRAGRSRPRRPRWPGLRPGRPRPRRPGHLLLRPRPVAADPAPHRRLRASGRPSAGRGRPGGQGDAVPLPADRRRAARSVHRRPPDPVGVRGARPAESAPVHRGAVHHPEHRRDRPDRLTGIFLVGGSSRIPLVAKLIGEQLGVTPVALDQPETAVALGALLVPISRDGNRTVAVADQQDPRRRGRR